MTTQSNTQNWMTVRQLSQAYAGFSESGLRWLIFNADDNGFSTCLRKIGRKILINTQDFEKWIESHKVSRGAK